MVIINSTPGVKKKYVDDLVKSSSTSITEATLAPVQINKIGEGTPTSPYAYNIGLKAIYTTTDSESGVTSPSADKVLPAVSLTDGTQYAVTMTVDAYGRVTAADSVAIAPTVPYKVGETAKEGYWATTIYEDGAKTEWHSPVDVTAEGNVPEITDANAGDLITAQAVQAMVNRGIASVYYVKGSKTGDELVALKSTTSDPITVGFVYNCSEDSSEEALPADKKFTLGANYVVTAVAEDGTLTFDKLSETLDLSPYAKTSDVKAIVAEVIEDSSEISADIKDLYAKKEDEHVTGTATLATAATITKAAEGDNFGEAKGLAVTYPEGTIVPADGDVIFDFKPRKVAYEAGLEVTKFDFATKTIDVAVDYIDCLTEDVTISFVVLVGSTSSEDADHKHPTDANYNTNTPAGVTTTRSSA